MLLINTKPYAFVSYLLNYVQFLCVMDQNETWITKQK